MRGVVTVQLVWLFESAAVVGPHPQTWYDELPLAFLAVAGGACLTATLTQQVSPGWREAALTLVFLLLACDLCAVLVYAATLSGGV
jgi:hypothetical protein